MHSLLSYASAQRRLWRALCLYAHNKDCGLHESRAPSGYLLHSDLYTLHHVREGQGLGLSCWFQRVNLYLCWSSTHHTSLCTTRWLRKSSFQSCSAWEKCESRSFLFSSDLVICSKENVAGVAPTVYGITRTWSLQGTCLAYGGICVRWEFCSTQKCCSPCRKKERERDDGKTNSTDKSNKGESKNEGSTTGSTDSGKALNCKITAASISQN